MQQDTRIRSVADPQRPVHIASSGQASRVQGQKAQSSARHYDATTIALCAKILHKRSHDPISYPRYHIIYLLGQKGFVPLSKSMKKPLIPFAAIKDDVQSILSKGVEPYHLLARQIPTPGSSYQSQASLRSRKQIHESAVMRHPPPSRDRARICQHELRQVGTNTIDDFGEISSSVVEFIRQLYEPFRCDSRRPLMTN
jgi:hypothetical protein